MPGHVRDSPANRQPFMVNRGQVHHPPTTIPYQQLAMVGHQGRLLLHSRTPTVHPSPDNPPPPRQPHPPDPRGRRRLRRMGLWRGHSQSKALPGPASHNKGACHANLAGDPRPASSGLPSPRPCTTPEIPDRKYLLVSRVPAKVLADVWRGMGEGQKQHCVVRIAAISQELAGAWQSDSMTGVDGARLGESWLDVCRSPKDYSSENLRRNVASWAWTVLLSLSLPQRPGTVQGMVDAGAKNAVGISDWG